MSKAIKSSINALSFIFYYSGLIHYFRKKSGNNVIIFYHEVYDKANLSGSVLEDISEIDKVDKARLNRHIRYLGKYYKIEKLDEILYNPERRRRAALTFDDGLRSVFNYFKSRKDDLPYTVFLNTYFYEHGVGIPIHNAYYAKKRRMEIYDIINGTIKDKHTNNLKLWANFNKESKLDISSLYLSNSDLDEIRCKSNITVGGHSHSHYRLSSLRPEEQFEEITKNKQFLEKIFQRRISLFAYPFGVLNKDFDNLTVDVLRESGFDFGLSAARNKGTLDQPYNVPRIWGGNKPIWEFACELEGVHLKPRKRVTHSSS
ncbi:polysaccharide deacetylase family protein [Candidatus Parcubacteria bacterium]|nr:MAG: polysaccharide deacetylase family protein [Candidatus Parcubacteria bacterium]